MFSANFIGRRPTTASDSTEPSAHNLPVPYRAPAPVAPAVVIRPHERLRAHEPRQGAPNGDRRLRGLIVDILV